MRQQKRQAENTKTGKVNGNYRTNDPTPLLPEEGGHKTKKTTTAVTNSERGGRGSDELRSSVTFCDAGESYPTVIQCLTGLAEGKGRTYGQYYRQACRRC